MLISLMTVKITLLYALFSEASMGLAKRLKSEVFLMITPIQLTVRQLLSVGTQRRQFKSSKQYSPIPQTTHGVRKLCKTRSGFAKQRK